MLKSKPYLGEGGFSLMRDGRYKVICSFLIIHYGSPSLRMKVRRHRFAHARKATGGGHQFLRQSRKGTEGHE
jgi:hypothetical protein